MVVEAELASLTVDRWPICSSCKSTRINPTSEHGRNRRPCSECIDKAEQIREAGRRVRAARRQEASRGQAR